MSFNRAKEIEEQLELNLNLDAFRSSRQAAMTHHVDEPNLNFFSKMMKSNNAKIRLGIVLGAALGAAIYALKGYLGIIIASVTSPMLICGAVIALIGGGITAHALSKKNAANLDSKLVDGLPAKNFTFSIYDLRNEPSPPVSPRHESTRFEDKVATALPRHPQALTFLTSIEDESKHDTAIVDSDFKDEIALPTYHKTLASIEEETQSSHNEENAHKAPRTEDKTANFAFFRKYAAPAIAAMSIGHLAYYGL